MSETCYTEVQIEMACKKLTITTRPPQVFIRGPSETVYTNLAEALIDTLRFYFAPATQAEDTADFDGWFRNDPEEF